MNLKNNFIKKVNELVKKEGFKKREIAKRAEIGYDRFNYILRGNQPNRDEYDRLIKAFENERTLSDSERIDQLEKEIKELKEAYALLKLLKRDS